MSARELSFETRPRRRSQDEVVNSHGEERVFARLRTMPRIALRTMRSLGATAGKPAAVHRVRRYRAAITMISTVFFGAASLASTVARAGVLPGDTQASHTAFISAKVLMSVR
jgi:hypothetical protein